MKINAEIRFLHIEGHGAKGLSLLHIHTPYKETALLGVCWDSYYFWIYLFFISIPIGR